MAFRICRLPRRSLRLHRLAGAAAGAGTGAGTGAAAAAAGAKLKVGAIHIWASCHFWFWSVVDHVISCYSMKMEVPGMAGNRAPSRYRISILS